MKGHKEDGKFHPHKQYKKGVRKKRIPTDKMVEPKVGVKINSTMHNEGIRLKKDEIKLHPLDKVITNMEKTFETYLNDHDFKNPKLRNKDWSVGITYEGGFSEEYFSFWAQPKDESIKPITYRSWISNYDWSEGMDEDSGYMEKLDKDPDFAQKEYEKWLADTFHAYGDAWFQSLADAIEDENS